MSRHTLDISQMQHLNELGVDTSNGSAYWYRIVQNKGDGNIRVISDWKLTLSLDIAYCTGHTLESIRTFTLQDILDLLPKGMVDEDDDKFVLKAEYGITRKVWYIGYYYYDATFNDLLFSGENLIDAAYEMLCWCIENGYVKTNKED